jgi:hypothetical protein
MAKKTKSEKPENTGDDLKLNAAGPTPPQKAADINPFDLAGLVVKPAYKTPTGMVTSMMAIPVRDKMGSASFFMTHPNPEYAQELYVLKFSEDGEETRGEWYVVHPNVAAAIGDDPALRVAKLYYCITQTGHESIVVVPVGDGGARDVYASKHAVFEAARSRFVKMRWTGGAMQWVYTYAETDGPEPPPNWPDESYQSILKRGFKSPKQDRFVDAIDHYVAKALRGIRPR